MNIRQLKIFLMVCETMSITDASKKLYLSQPAISKAIRELETSIGILLFDRINGKLYLNEDGKAFQIKARQLIKEFEILENFSRYSGDEVPLRIGTSLTIALNSLPYVIKQFKEKYPKTPLKIYSENVRHIQRKLLNGEIDLAFIEGFGLTQDFDTELLSEYELFFVHSTQNKWNTTNQIASEDLSKLPFLLREKGSTLRDSFDKLTHKLNIEVSPVLESTNTEVLIRAAKAGLGITILPEPLALPYLNDNTLSRIFLEGNKMSTVNYAITLKGKVKNKRHHDMIESFKKAEMQYKTK